MIQLHVENCDDMVRTAKAAGAEVIREPQDQFYGERSAKLRDPFGHEWDIGSYTEDVSVTEMQRRFEAMFDTDA